MKKILISVTAHMGDFIWATSAIAVLKKTYPQYKITILAPKSIKELIEHNPVIDDVIYSPFSNNDTKSKIRKFLWSLKAVPEIFLKRFDISLIFDSSKISVLLSKLAFIPKIAGGDLFWAGYDIKDPVAKFYTDKITLPKDQDHIHSSIRFQTIVKSVFGIYNNAMPILPDSKSYYEKTNALIKDKNKILVALCVKGSKNTSHVWDIENFKNVIKLIKNEINNTHFYIVGTKNDFEYAQMLTDDINVFNICGKTSLLTLREFLNTAKLLISLDTGLIHLAATTKTNILSLHGATSPDTTGPMSCRASTVYLSTECSPCSYTRNIEKKSCPSYPKPACLSNITAEKVSEKAIKILKK